MVHAFSSMLHLPSDLEIKVSGINRSYDGLCGVFRR